MANVSIDRTAVLAEGARVSEGCKIGPWSQLGPEVRLGPRCQLGARVRITGRVTIGPDNIIRSGVLIGCREDSLSSASFASSAGEEPGRVEIGSGNTIREYSIIYGSPQAAAAGESSSREKPEEGPTDIGDENLIMAYTVIKAGARLESGINIANATVIGAGAVIQQQAFLGGMVQVKEGVTMGRLSMLGGDSCLTEDLPPFLLADGNPARVRGLNIIALRRAGYTRSDLRDLKKIYRNLYRSGSGNGQTNQQLEDGNSKQAGSQGAELRQTGSQGAELSQAGEIYLNNLKNTAPETEAGRELQQFLLARMKDGERSYSDLKGGRQDG